MAKRRIETYFTVAGHTSIPDDLVELIDSRPTLQSGVLDMDSVSKLANLFHIANPLEAELDAMREHINDGWRTFVEALCVTALSVAGKAKQRVACEQALFFLPSGIF